MERESWTYEKIKNQISFMVKEKDMNRMPSRSEVDTFFGDYKLSNAISKRKLWAPLAKELNLPLKNSETAFGKTYEAKAMEELIVKGYEVRKMSQNFPYDLLVNDAVKIDVKASKLYCGSAGNFYSFNLEKQYSTCDCYILYLVGSQNETKDILIVPSPVVATNTQISVGEKKSKYHSYSKRWDYIDKYCKLADEVRG